MRQRKGIALVAAGLVAGLALGSFGIASAVTGSDSTSLTASAGLATPGGPGGGRGGHGGGPGLGRGPGGGDLGGAVAELTGLDIDDVMSKRVEGTSFAAIAKTKGVSADEVVDEAYADAKTLMDAQVKVGRMTAEQEKQSLAELKTRLESEVESTEALPERGGRGGHGRGGELASAVAEATGLSVDDVMSKRAEGTSFAAIAKTKGVSADDVIAAAIKEATTELTTRLEAEIDETGTVGPGGRFGGPGAPGGF